MVKVKLCIEEDGYITGWTDEQFADQTKLTEVDQAELDTCVLGATKLTDGHLVLDTAKQAEINKPVPTDQDEVNASLLRTQAQLQLANATLLKQLATLQQEASNG